MTRPGDVISSNVPEHGPNAQTRATSACRNTRVPQRGEASGVRGTGVRLVTLGFHFFSPFSSTQLSEFQHIYEVVQAARLIQEHFQHTEANLILQQNLSVPPAPRLLACWAHFT